MVHIEIDSINVGCVNMCPAYNPATPFGVGLFFLGLFDGIVRHFRHLTFDKQDFLADDRIEFDFLDNLRALQVWQHTPCGLFIFRCVRFALPAPLWSC